ncbi:hypothetical protein AVEN_98979-1 [Araneus ventricosus]|uniref:Uncharacterized protein n=1 Tax=Araneus ventricosus TaxID=182803 RepID=A0A4Y2G5C8_ARAVE|nr:hypothetical protein AVEN_98979-1 [Araneus ventricosus]
MFPIRKSHGAMREKRKDKSNLCDNIGLGAGQITKERKPPSERHSTQPSASSNSRMEFQEIPDPPADNITVSRTSWMRMPSRFLQEYQKSTRNS